MFTRPGLLLDLILFDFGQFLVNIRNRGAHFGLAQCANGM